MTIWGSCSQGSKPYLDKLNCRAACIIEGHTVKSDALSTIFGLAPFASVPKLRFVLFFVVVVLAFALKEASFLRDLDSLYTVSCVCTRLR